MKFALVLAICSSIAGDCAPHFVSPYEYQSHYDCLHAGYLTSITVIQNFGSETVNAHEIYIQFKCTEQHNL